MFRILFFLQILLVCIDASLAFANARSTNDIEFFQQRWSSRSIPLKEIDEQQPSNSLSIRGGGTTGSALNSISRTFSFPSEETINNIVLASNRNNEAVVITSATTTSLQRSQLLQSKNLKQLSAVAFVVSSVVFFAGSHLETVWTTIRPKIGNWIQQQARRRSSTIQRNNLPKILLGLTIGTFVCPTLTIMSGASALIARSILLEVRRDYNTIGNQLI